MQRPLAYCNPSVPVPLVTACRPQCTVRVPLQHSFTTLRFLVGPFNMDDSNSSGDFGGDMASPTVSSTMYSASVMALTLTCQDWTQLGHGDDPDVAASTDLAVTVNRVLALFLVRIVALISHRESIKTGVFSYSDLSTTTICQTALERGSTWDGPITESLISELRAYIQQIFEQYKQVSYHNFEHAYHVIISTNKLLDLMLHEDQGRTHHKTFGLRSDALSHLALLFSALVHDVEHQGVTNRQLVLESDRLALLYNDQSVAEQRSLAIAFAELTKDEYQTLRSVLFEDVEEYRRFRKTVINLVLTTDIASPERTQIVKSKWKEAFGDKKDLSEIRVNIQMVRSGDEPADDDASETSTSVTPESCEGLEHVFETSPPLTGSRSEENMATRAAQHAISSIPPRRSRIASTPSQSDTRLPLPRSQDIVTRSRTASSGDRMTSRGSSGSLEDKKVARRFSMPTSSFDMKKAHVRLGIRRSLDLTGDIIEPYIVPVARSVKNDPIASVPEGSSDGDFGDPDDPDELRASVVMEQLLKAADVAPNMQGWDQLEKWSGRLFFELMDSFEAGRGEDPRQGWFRNQITFLESYMLPLARRLHATQVFGDTIGPMFAQIVEDNRDRWISDGVLLTAQITQKCIYQNQISTIDGDDT